MMPAAMYLEDNAKQERDVVPTKCSLIVKG